MEKTTELAKKLQKHLHTIPELSGCETETKKALIDFLKQESDLEIIDCGKWFYAAHREEGAEEGMAFRADMDAVTGADSRPYHGCGHDGHSSVMAALAAWTTGKRFGKNLFFLFQHAEETGAGAAQCCAIFEKEKIGAIYGFHNCPGFPAGSVLLLHDTFACASKGLRLIFEGSQTHAAYPENGKNPVTHGPVSPRRETETRSRAHPLPPAETEKRSLTHPPREAGTVDTYYTPDKRRSCYETQTVVTSAGLRAGGRGCAAADRSRPGGQRPPGGRKRYADPAGDTVYHGR